MTGAQKAVHEHLDAFNAHDTGRLLAGLAPDAVWLTGQDRVEGTAGLAGMFGSWLWSLTPSLTVRSMVVDGSRVAAELLEVLTVEGEQRAINIAVFFEVRDGLIRSVKVYREGSAHVADL